MGQKINPTGLRIGVIKNWESRWYAGKSTFGDTLVEDYNLREYLLATLAPAGVPKVEIERDAKRVYINIHCAKPGMVIGRGGSEIEKLKEICKKKLGGDKDVSINIIEIKQPDLDAQLVAENIASQLERRISFRRAMKQCIGRTMKLGAKGIKIQCSGRLGGAEIARSETLMRVQFPFRQSVQTSTTALLRQRQLTVVSALRFGFTRARFSMRLTTIIADHAVRRELNNAVT